MSNYIQNRYLEPKNDIWWKNAKVGDKIQCLNEPNPNPDGSNAPRGGNGFRPNGICEITKICNYINYCIFEILSKDYSLIYSNSCKPYYEDSLIKETFEKNYNGSIIGVNKWEIDDVNISEYPFDFNKYNISNKHMYTIGDYVKILDTMSMIKNRPLTTTGKFHIGANVGDIVKITGACNDFFNGDSRYYGDNWNLKSEDFELYRCSDYEPMIGFDGSEINLNKSNEPLDLSKIDIKSLRPSIIKQKNTEKHINPIVMPVKDRTKIVTKKRIK